MHVIHCKLAQRNAPWPVRTIAVLLVLLVGTWSPASRAAATIATTTAEAAGLPASFDPDEELMVLDEVVVYGTDGRLIEGMYAESELDEAAMAAYGANTVGDLLAQVAPDVDNTEEGPVILINGRPANGITSVNQLPSESVASIQVLPAQAAAALGYGPTRRVINVVLKTNYRQALVNATVKGATAGRGLSANGNTSLVSVDGNRFQSLSLTLLKNQPLLESHRDIESQQPAGMPYDLLGNVVSWPVPGMDIDPALSGMTGFPVTVLGVPAGLQTPTLADFLASANSPNPGEVSRYRTLVADQFTLGMNGNLSLPLPRNTFLNLGLYAERGVTVSRTGAAGALLHVPADSPFSPFSRDVAVARYLGSPLERRDEPWAATLNSNVNTQLGRWRVTMSGNLTRRATSSDTDRYYDTRALQAAMDAGLVDPFAPLPPELLDELLVDHARSNGRMSNLQLQASGTVLKLPAGNTTLALRGELRDSRNSSRTTGTTDVRSRRVRKDEMAFASLQIPLLGKPTPQAFGMGAELSVSARDVTGLGTLYDHGYGLNWRFGQRFTLRASVNEERVAPQPESLSAPIVVIDDMRTYDFIRQETVLVRYITGGNPDLDVERRRGTRIGMTMRPLAATDLQLNLDYQRTVGRDATLPLPAVSEDVQAAFPDRYRRDVDGRLVEVDARLVSFARSETGQIRWGGSFRRSFGQPGAGAAAAQTANRVVFMDGSGTEQLSGPGWRLNANFTHTWQLENRRLAREGLPVQDLLAGGPGTGSSQSRHAVNARVGTAYNGTGLQLAANWKSRTRFTAGTADDPNDIVFSPLLRLDLTGFADLGTVFPQKEMLKGVRVTLAAENLLDARQRVRDQNGHTPLRYQPYLLDALGRTVSLSLRKSY